MPKVGAIEDGYRFNGGDPSKPESWEPMQAAEPPRMGSGSMLMDAAAGIAPPGMAERVGNFAKPSILPTLGSYAGGAAGTAFPVLGPVTPLVGRGIGSGLGEGVNQLTGITEPSLGNLALATGLGPALEGGANLARTGMRFLGGRGAETLNALAPKEAQRVMKGYRSGENVTQLFKQATDEGVSVPLAKTQTMLQQIENEVATATPAGQKAWKSILRETGVDDLATSPAGASPAKLQSVMADIGKLKSKAASEGGLKADKLGKLFSSLSDDLEQVPALATARQVFKRERVLDEIDDQIAKAFQINRGQGEAGQFNANKVINTLQNEKDQLGKYFSQAFKKGEQKEIVDFFKFLNELPALQPGAGQQFGSGRAIARTLGPSIVGGGLGASGGDPAMGAIGAAAGALLPPTADAAKMLMQAWRMEGGKSLIKNLLRNSDGALTPKVLSLLGAFVSGQASTQIRPPDMSPAGTIRPFAMQP